jgi:hypothetical protein
MFRPFEFDFLVESLDPSLVSLACHDEPLAPDDQPDSVDFHEGLINQHCAYATEHDQPQRAER